MKELIVKPLVWVQIPPSSLMVEQGSPEREFAFSNSLLRFWFISIMVVRKLVTLLAGVQFPHGPNFIPRWCNGSTRLSESLDGGSIPPWGTISYGISIWVWLRKSDKLQRVAQLHHPVSSWIGVIGSTPGWRPDSTGSIPGFRTKKLIEIRLTLLMFIPYFHWLASFIDTWHSGDCTELQIRYSTT